MKTLTRAQMMRWNIANWLAWAAAQLRGEVYYDCGWGVQANEPSLLADSILIDIAINLPDGEFKDGLTDRVNSLAEIARSNWWNPAFLPECCQPKEQLTAAKD